MKVILRDHVENLGRLGEVVDVKPGYARNYLLPKELAVMASTTNMKALEHERRIIMERGKKLMADAEAKAARLNEVTVTIAAKAGEEEKLFGSVTTMDIAEALAAKGIEVDKKKLHLAEPIKRLGEHTAEVRVAPELTATVTVQVVAESAEA